MYNKKWLVSIILLNCNWKKRNKDCIDSLLIQTYKNYEIIFVNNMSTDWSLEEVQEIYKKEIDKWIIKIALNPSNTWFTWGNNLWVKNSSKNSEYICLLNNDTTVWKDWLENLVKPMYTDKTLWAIQSVVLEWDKNQIMRNIFEKNIVIWTNIYSWFIFNKVSNWLLKQWYCYTTFVHWCCFLYRKNIIDLPFEDYYFIYAEDVYLSRRILSKWYNLWLSFNSFVNHYWWWTCGKINEINIFRQIRNRQINFLVFNPLLFVLLMLPLFFLTELSTLLTWNISMKIKAEFKSLYRIIKNYKLIKKSNKKIREESRISNSKFTNLLSHKLIDIFFIRNLWGLYTIFIPFIHVINLIYISYYYIIRIILFWY